MRVFVLYKKSALEMYQETSEGRDFLASGAAGVSAVRESHEVQKRTLETVLGVLRGSQGNHVTTCLRPEFSPEAVRRGNYDLVVSVGGDGAFLDVARGIADDTRILGVNSDPTRSRGFFSYATGETFETVLGNIDSGPVTELSRIEIHRGGEVIGRALNEVMVAYSVPAVSTKLTLDVDGLGVDRYTRTYGLMVCTAAGSTGGMYEEGGELMPLEDRRLQYHMRGVRNSPFLFAEEKLVVCPLIPGIEIYPDGAKEKIPLALQESIVLKPGSNLHVVGDLTENRKRFLGD